jgi:hypothetical protein
MNFPKVHIFRRVLASHLAFILAYLIVGLSLWFMLKISLGDEIHRLLR